MPTASPTPEPPTATPQSSVTLVGLESDYYEELAEVVRWAVQAAVRAVAPEEKRLVVNRGQHGEYFVLHKDTPVVIRAGTEAECYIHFSQGSRFGYYTESNTLILTLWGGQPSTPWHYAMLTLQAPDAYLFGGYLPRGWYDGEDPAHELMSRVYEENPGETQKERLYPLLHYTE